VRTHIGQYRIEAPLGRGGMGVVYRGVHEHLGRPVAIKALAPELTQQPEFKERFFSEAKTQARLQHPNIVGVYDLLEDAGDFFIVMELVVGEALDDILRARNGQGMDLGEAAAIFNQILAALDYAHSEGVIHRDIKPSNVMITPGGRIKLTDFGIALLIGDKRLTASQSAIGTPTYMSPEQILRPRSVDHRTDIYSAAVVFFEMIAGVPPFDGESEYTIKKLHVEAPPPDLTTLNPLVPVPVVAAISAALAKDPEARFPSAGMFQRALHEAVPFAIPAAAAPLPAPVYRPTVADAPATGVVPPPPAPSSAIAAAGTAGGRAPAPVSPSSPPASSWLSGPRLIGVAAAAVLILGLGFGMVYLLLNRNHGAAETTAAVQTPVPAPAAAPVQQAALPAAVSEPLQMPAAPVQPMAAPLTPAPAAAPTTLPQQSAPPVERPRNEKTVPRVKETKGETPPPPPPPKETPKPVEEAPQVAAAPPPAPEPGGGGSGTALGQLQDMEDVVMSVERFGKQASEAFSDSDGSGEVGGLLEKFADSAEGVRKEFRRASGTGLGGLKAKLLRFGKGGQQADTKVLEGKAKELIRQGEAIDRAIKSDPLPPAAQQFWSDARAQLRKLGRFFP
jgi:serine/threonine protein kinase